MHSLFLVTICHSVFAQTASLTPVQIHKAELLDRTTEITMTLCRILPAQKGADMQAFVTTPEPRSA